jgi:hypothetical protein
LVCALLLALLLALRLIQTPGLQAARQAVKAALTGDTGLTNLTDGWEALTDSLGGLRQNFQGLLEEPEAAPPAGTPRVDEDILRALDRPDPYGGF